MAKTTTATVNRIFKQKGFDIKMYRAKEGYYYFVNEKMNLPSLYMYSISGEDPAGIVAEILKWVR